MNATQLYFMAMSAQTLAAQAWAEQRFADAQQASLWAACAWALLAQQAATFIPYSATPETARAARHGGYSAGIRKAPRRPTADDKARAEAQKWRLA